MSEKKLPDSNPVIRAARNEVVAATRYIRIVEDRIERERARIREDENDALQKRDSREQTIEALILLGVSRDDIERVIEQTLTEYEKEQESIRGRRLVKSERMATG